MSRAAARRFVLTLEHLGYVGTDAKGRYFLRAKTLALGYSYLASLNIGEHIRPILKRTVDLTGCSSSLVVLDGFEIVYIARAISPQPIQINVQVGDRLPAYVTSTGKVLLAGKSDQDIISHVGKEGLEAFTNRTITSVEELLDQLAIVRRQGYAVAKGEYAMSVFSVGVPVRDTQGRVIAAVNVNSQFGGEVTDQIVENCLPALREAASDMEVIITSVSGASEMIGGMAV